STTKLRRMSKNVEKNFGAIAQPTNDNIWNTLILSRYWFLNRQAKAV
ncbi:6864_t:CDS:1, partial [Cetraspora pellucida]